MNEQVQPSAAVATAPPVEFPSLGRGLLDALTALRREEARVVQVLADHPTEALVTTLLAASVLFYRAEVGRNPRVVTFMDALHYISTCYSVGYANIFPVTEAGKLIGAVMMLFGPALAAKALDTAAPRPASRVPRPHPETGAERGATRSTALLLAENAHKLDANLTELRKR